MTKKIEYTFNESDIKRIINITQYFKTAIDNFCDDSPAKTIIYNTLSKKLSDKDLKFVNEILFMNTDEVNIKLK